MDEFQNKELKKVDPFIDDFVPLEYTTGYYEENPHLRVFRDMAKMGRDWSRFPKHILHKRDVDSNAVKEDFDYGGGVQEQAATTTPPPSSTTANPETLTWLRHQITTLSQSSVITESELAILLRLNNSISEESAATNLLFTTVELMQLGQKVREREDPPTTPASTTTKSPLTTETALEAEDEYVIVNDEQQISTPTHESLVETDVCKNLNQFKIAPGDDKATVRRKYGKSF